MRKLVLISSSGFCFKFPRLNWLSSFGLLKYWLFLVVQNPYNYLIDAKHSIFPMSCNVFQMTCDYKNHWENQPNQFFCRFFKNLRIEIWRFDMTSKSVRRNVTRSWGLSLEKIEFFSTDFLRWVSFPMPQRDIIHSQSLVTIIMFSYSKIICRHLPAKKKLSNFQMLPDQYL